MRMQLGSLRDNELARTPMNSRLIGRARRVSQKNDRFRGTRRAHLVKIQESVFSRVLCRLPNESFLGRIEQNRFLHEKAILRKTENSNTSTVPALREELPSRYAGRRGAR
jgi:hypothetical protein